MNETILKHLAHTQAVLDSILQIQVVLLHDYEVQTNATARSLEAVRKDVNSTINKKAYELFEKLKADLRDY